MDQEQWFRAEQAEADIPPDIEPYQRYEQERKRLQEYWANFSKLADRYHVE